MAASKVAIVYSESTGRVRSWVVFDGENENDGHLNLVRLGKGESLHLLPRAEYGDLFTLQAAVNQVTGKSPSDDRYAVVDDKGDVVAAVHADTVGCADALPNKQLIKSAYATPGWKLDAQVGLKPPYEVGSPPDPLGVSVQMLNDMIARGEIIVGT